MSEAMRTGVHDPVVLVEQAISLGTDAKSINLSVKRLVLNFQEARKTIWIELLNFGDDLLYFSP